MPNRLVQLERPCPAEVLAEVTAWRSRPLEAGYAVVFFDALRLKIREEGVVRNKAVYLALGVQRDGTRDIPGIWIETTEGAKFWMKVFNDLESRGVNDILIAVTDGLTGVPCRWRPESASIRRRMPAGSLVPALAPAGGGVSIGLPMLS